MHRSKSGPSVQSPQPAAAAAAAACHEPRLLTSFDSAEPLGLLPEAPALRKQSSFSSAGGSLRRLSQRISVAAGADAAAALGAGLEEPDAGGVAPAWLDGQAQHQMRAALVSPFPESMRPIGSTVSACKCLLLCPDMLLTTCAALSLLPACRLRHTSCGTWSAAAERPPMLRRPF